MSKKIIISIIIGVIGISVGTGYFLLNTDNKNTAIDNQEKTTPSKPQNEQKVITPTQTETDGTTKGINGVIQFYNWTNFAKEHTFTFETPADWEIEDMNNDVTYGGIRTGWVKKIKTIKSSQRPAVGFEIQSPEDEKRMVTVNDAQIYFRFENLQDNGLDYNYSTGVKKTADGNLVCFIEEPYYDTGLPTYGTVLGEKIKICPIENVENSSYGLSLVVYIPITENQGLVIDGSLSEEGSMTIQEFLPIYKKVLSTFRWIE